MRLNRTGLMLMLATAAWARAGATFDYSHGFVLGSMSLKDNTSGVEVVDSLSNPGSRSLSLQGVGTASFSAGATQIGGRLNVRSNNATCFLSLFTDTLRVTETTQVLFEWSTVDTTTSWGQGTFVGGGTLAEIQPSGDYVDLISVLPQTSGAQMFTLEAGKDYATVSPRFTVYLNKEGAYADLFVRVTIVPAPGTMLAAVGLLATSRRRRG